MKISGLIMARGGSKRVIGKNLRVIAGKSLLQWTIEALMNAQHVDNVFVSTDDKESAFDINDEMDLIFSEQLLLRRIKNDKG